MKKLSLAMGLLLPLSGLAQANMIINGGFEDGDTGSFSNVTIPGWTMVGTNGWHHGRSGETLDDKAVKLKDNKTDIYQDVPVIAGKQYNVSAQLTSFTRQALIDREAIVDVEWFSGSSSLGSDRVGSYVAGVDAYDQWKPVAKTLTAPANATTARIIFYVDNIGSGATKHAHIDNVTMAEVDSGGGNGNGGSGEGPITTGYFENFDGLGQPQTMHGTWRYFDDMLPIYGWNEIAPGDGFAYLTIDANTNNDQDSSSPFQDIRFNEVGPGNRIEMRAKNLAISGVGGFIFTYQEDATSFDEIDIEVAYNDIKTTDTKGRWSDARFNSWGNANPYGPYLPIESIGTPVVDENDNKISVEDDQFHTFTIEWQHYDGIKGNIDFYIDGIYQATINDVVGDSLSEVILGYRQMSWTGDLDWSGTRTMVIDWFRVSPVNDNSPSATIDRYNVTKNEDLVVSAAQGVLINDQQQNGLNAQLLSQPEHGVVIFNSDGSFTYQPDNNYVGEDTFVYKTNTNKGESNAAVVKLTVSGTSSGGGTIENGGFEDGTAPWAYYLASRVSNNAYEGSRAAEITAGGDVINIVSGLKPNTTYKVIARIKTTGKAGLYVRNYGGAKLSNSTTSSSYTNKSLTFTTGATDTSVDVYVYASSGLTFADAFTIEEL